MKKQVFLGLLLTSALLNTIRCQASDTISTQMLKRTAYMAELDTKQPQAKKQRIEKNETLEHLLRIATFEGKTDLVQNFLTTKVNVNAKTKLGCTILDTSLCGFEKHGNNSDAIKLLIQAGAQLTNQTSLNKTTFELFKILHDKKYKKLAKTLNDIDFELYCKIIKKSLDFNFFELTPYLIALSADLTITTPCAITYYQNSLHNANLHTPTKNYGKIIQKLDDCPHGFSSSEDYLIAYYTSFFSVPTNLEEAHLKKKIGTIEVPGFQQPFDLYFSIEYAKSGIKNGPELLLTYYVTVQESSEAIASINLNYYLHGMFIDQLYVKKDCSKNGIGSFLVAKSIELAKALGCILINLHASPFDYHENCDVEKLAQWYRRFGFIGDQQEEESEIFIPMLLTLINLELPEYAYSNICAGDYTQALALRLRTNPSIT